ncbi:unnamed protein product [Trichogramma brassicae]|uniref:Uncharacterized protein n=1 Tax=Trichogramma brassicae TaxID=86971 RepID=A0A6H5IT69_9HYME|nr:unnamed protein product [Trichogramma brassicae]
MFTTWRCGENDYHAYVYDDNNNNNRRYGKASTAMSSLVASISRNKKKPFSLHETCVPQYWIYKQYAISSAPTKCVVDANPQQQKQLLH